MADIHLVAIMWVQDAVEDHTPRSDIILGDRAFGMPRGPARHAVRASPPWWILPQKGHLLSH